MTCAGFAMWAATVNHKFLSHRTSVCARGGRSIAEVHAALPVLPPLDGKLAGPIAGRQHFAEHI